MRLEPFTERTVTDPAVLRAEVLRIRDAGWAVVDQELESGLRSVAVPVRGPGGEVIAAINTSMQATPGAGESTLEEAVAGVLPALKEASGKITAALAARGQA